MLRPIGFGTRASWQWGHMASWLPIHEYRYFLPRMARMRESTRGWWGRIRAEHAETIARRGISVIEPRRASLAAGAAGALAAAMTMFLSGEFLAGALPACLWLAIGVAIPCLAGIIFTVTRQAWLGAAVGSLVALGAVPRLRAYAVPLVAGGVLLVVVSFAVIPGLQLSISATATSPVERFEPDSDQP